MSSPDTQAEVAPERAPDVLDTAEHVTDQAGFDRIRYQLDQQTTLVFRGREEMPVFADGTPTEVLSSDEVPGYTDTEEYRAWLDSRPAADSDADRLELLATATPRGVVEAASELVRRGFGDPERVGDLEQLRQKLREGTVDDEVTSVYDALCVAAVGGESEQVDQQAPMEVALMLAGNAEAAERLQAKLENLIQLDQAAAEATDGGTKRLPGERLTEDELKILAEGHFVAVHTTRSNPLEQDNALRPTSAYPESGREAFPRSTIHFSLNHPVESHLDGNFAERPYTIVAPLEDLARDNGAPAVLYGVDTYFSLNPGERLDIPDSAVVVDTRGSEGSPVIAVDGQMVRINGEALGREGLAPLVEFMTERYGWESGLFDGTPKQVTEIHRSRLINLLVDSDQFQFIDDDRMTDENLAKLSAIPEDYARRQLDYITPRKAFVDLARELAGDEEFDSHARSGELATRTLEHMMDHPETLADHPEFQPILQEAIRLVIVQEEIRLAGGETVRSDRSSAYIQDSTFQESENRIARELRLRSGLHISHSEEFLESSYSRARTEASHPNPDDLRDGFHWDRYSSKDVWSVVRHAPWQTRRTGVATGMLTFDRKPPAPPETDPFAV